MSWRKHLSLTRLYPISLLHIFIGASSFVAFEGIIIMTSRYKVILEIILTKTHETIYCDV